MTTSPVPVCPGEATGWDLHARLPPTLSPDAVRAVNTSGTTIHDHRSYTWNGWDFDLPPGVFAPGGTSRLVHDRLLDATFPVAGLRYVAMGAGLGVEAVVAGVRGAARVHALDVHEPSVRAAAAHYARIVGPDGPPLHPLVADVWDGFPDGVQADVITFNPPAIDLPLSDDPDVVRNLCVGPGIVGRFLDGITTRGLLAPGGTVYLVLSNTGPLRAVVARALDSGFDVAVAHVQEWPGIDVQTYVFALTSRGDTIAG